MSNKILYISKKSPLADKYAVVISEEYQVENRRMSSRALYRELNDVALMVIYVSAWEPEDYDLLHAFLTIMPNEFIPAVLLGAPSDIKQFKAHMQYPFQGEIDASAKPLKLCKSIQEYLVKYYPPQSNPVPVVKPGIFIYHKDLDLLQRLKLLLAESYEVAIINSDRALFRFFDQKTPKLLIMQHDAAFPDETKDLLARIRDREELAQTPLVLFGDTISNEVLQSFLAYRIKGYLMSDVSDEDLLATVDRLAH